jgi:4-aminobutyrate aminotransferase
MWAVEHEGVVPDILVFAKGIASGMVLSGIAARGGMMAKSPPGSMGGTFGANAVSAAAAVATLDVIREEGLLANATARGNQLQEGLRALAARHPGHIFDVRGRGCMVGLEFNHPAGSGFAAAVTAEAMNQGLLLLTTGWRETIRFIPPLIVSQAEMAQVRATRARAAGSGDRAPSLLPADTAGSPSNALAPPSAPLLVPAQALDILGSAMDKVVKGWKAPPGM